MKIQLNSGIIDLHVNRKKYDILKTKVGQFNLVKRILDSILTNLTSHKQDGFEIRLATITSNHFWGQEDLAEMNEIGWRGEDTIPKNEEFITFRIFNIDITSIITSDVEDENELVKFPTIEGKGFKIDCSSCRII